MRVKDILLVLYFKVWFFFCNLNEINNSYTFNDLLFIIFEKIIFIYAVPQVPFGESYLYFFFVQDIIRISLTVSSAFPPLPFFLQFISLCHEIFLN